MTRKYSSLELSAPKAEHDIYVIAVCQLVQVLLSGFGRFKSFRRFARPDYDLWMGFVQNHVRANPDSGLMAMIKPDGLWMTTTSDGTITGTIKHCEQDLPQGRQPYPVSTVVNIVSLLRRMFERRGVKCYHAPRADRLRGPLGVDQIFTELPVFDVDECVGAVLADGSRTIVIAVYEGEVHLYDEAEPERGHVFKFATYNPALAGSLPEL